MDIQNLSSVDRPHDTTGATMLSEVTDHFKTSFSNVAKGQASTTEYLEVGTLVTLGTLGLTYGALKLVPKHVPVALQDFKLAGQRAPVFNPGSAKSTLGVAEQGEASVALNKAIVDFAAKAKASAETAGRSTTLAPPDKTLFVDATMTDERLAMLIPRYLNLGKTPVHLDFRGSNLTDKGAAALLDLRHNLKSLDVSRTYVTDSGMAMLRRGLPNTSFSSKSQHWNGASEVPGMTRTGLDDLIASSRGLPERIGNRSKGIDTQVPLRSIDPYKPWEAPNYKWRPPTDDRNHKLLSYRRFERPSPLERPD